MKLRILYDTVSGAVLAAEAVGSRRRETETGLEFGGTLVHGPVQHLASATVDSPVADPIGWRYDGQKLMPPPQEPSPASERMPPPNAVTMRQARLALLAAGLLDDVEAAIAAIPDETQRRAVQIEWEYAQEVRRDSSLVQQLAARLELSDAQIDALFEQASRL
ncbi:MAG: hypothetical protein N2690_00505 [Rhodocyclaceae bacterium]|nr:hypothetical protein [Rhodocyclaceae bacterium]